MNVVGLWKSDTYHLAAQGKFPKSMPLVSGGTSVCGCMTKSWTGWKAVLPKEMEVLTMSKCCTIEIFLSATSYGE